MKTYFENPQTANDETKKRIPELLKTAGIPSNARGESLSQEQFIELGKAYLSLI